MGVSVIGDNEGKMGRCVNGRTPWGVGGVGSFGFLGVALPGSGPWAGQGGPWEWPSLGVGLLWEWASQPSRAFSWQTHARLHDFSLHTP